MKTDLIILIISALVLLFLCWKEFRRVPVLARPARLLASTLAIAAFACLALKPQYTRELNLPVSSVSIRSTGAGPAASAAQFSTDPGFVKSPTRFLPDLEVFLAKNPSVNTVEVFGDGLEEHELQVIHDKRIRYFYHAPEPVTGFTQAGWTRVIQRGENLRISGSFYNTTGRKISIRLAGGGQQSDSTRPSDSTEIPYDLKLTPAFSGPALYQLVARNDSGQEWVEKVPVNILPPQKLKLLMLAAAPDFENKFLLRWLYEDGHAIAMRYAIAPGKYGYEFLNRSSNPFPVLNESILNETDVLLTTDLALSGLSAAERNLIQLRVREGLGIIIQSDSGRSLSPFSSRFATSRLRSGFAPYLQLAGERLPLTGTGHQLQPAIHIQPVVTGEQNSVFAALSFFGAGPVVFCTPPETYAWVLSGNQAGYAAYWSSLLSTAARRPPATTRIAVSPAFPYSQEETRLKVLGEIKSLETDHGRILLQPSALPDEFSGRFWPRETGWQVLRTPPTSARAEADTTMLYIYEKGDWIQARASARIAANRQMEKDSSDWNQGEQFIKTTERVLVPPIIFFLLFMIAMSYLWFESKKLSL